MISLGKSAALLAMVLALPLLGCDPHPKAAIVPPPQEPTAESVAYFCGMAELDHHGPKGQIFLTDKSVPVWFSSVRDAFAFTLLPEEPKNIAVIYVNDMAKAGSAMTPPPGSWIEAKKAWFVAGSDYRAGMGVAEIVPFADEAAARHFMASHGGRLQRFAQVTEAEVLDDDRDSIAAAGQTATVHEH